MRTHEPLPAAAQEKSISPFAELNVPLAARNGHLCPRVADSTPWMRREISAVRTLRDGIAMVIEPRRSQGWAEFQATHGPYCLAANGRVTAGPRCDELRKQMNLDHHYEVDRLATPCSCMQEYQALRDGRLLSTLAEPGGKPRVILCLKYCDPDEALCAALLQRYQVVCSGGLRGAIEHYLRLEDLFDRSGGALLIDPRSKDAEQLAWICVPFEEFRLGEQRGTPSCDGPAMARVVAGISARFWAAVEGRCGRHPLDTRCSILERSGSWLLIQEHGFYGRLGLTLSTYDSSTQAFIAVREMGEGSFRYSVGKLPGGNGFPLTALYTIFNAAEFIDPRHPDRWGGSDHIGGSPLMRESRLTPREVWRITNAFLSFAGGQEPTSEMVYDFIVNDVPGLYTPKPLRSFR